ncbi:substrate-binding periplasmic protein [Herbaspirillum rhizosphaerae]|uniref:substrate-binding periplasmic protein n=1 Tax=Herbaspirillum rhizosphaerae TaxID=346179 RepID=UPI0009FA69DD|nr:transporter substrate-binding domain-containing protein [Herbaspirillum rhizosphaerae]
MNDVHNIAKLGRHLLLWFGAASCSLVHAAECSKLIISGGSDYPPLHWYDGSQLTGASIEVATTALKALKIPYELRYMGPFYRVLEGAKNGEVDMIATLKDSPERREFLSFATPSPFTSPIAVFTLRSRPFTYREWNDLIGKKGGITLGYQFGEGFDDFLKKQLKVETEKKTSVNFLKLERGTIDYLITGYYNGLAYLAENKQTDHFTVHTPYVTDAKNYIALSRNSPCIKYLKSINQQLESMQNNGATKAILEKYTGMLLNKNKSM